MLRGRRIKGGGRRRRREGREGREGGGGRVSVVVSFPFRFFSSLYLLGGGGLIEFSKAVATARVYLLEKKKRKKRF